MQLLDQAKGAAAQAAAYAAHPGVSGLLSFVAHDGAGAAWAVETAKQLRAQQRAMEAQLASIVAPAKEAVRAAKAVFKPPIDAVGRVIDHLKRTAADHDQRQAAAQRQALAAAAATSSPVEIAAAVELTSAKSIPTRTDWSATITDAAAVPREYCVPDMVRLNALAREHHEALCIPGVEAVAKIVPVLR